MNPTPVQFFGPDARFHHVGVAVASIDATHPCLTKFTDPIQKVHVAFIDLHGATVELIEPTGADSPVTTSLAKGIKLLHMCYEVPKLEDAVSEAAKHGLRQISRPAPAVAFDNRRITWLYHALFGLFELVER